MKKHKIWANVVLMAFMFTNLLPTNALAEETVSPVPTTPKITLVNPALNPVKAGSDVQVTFKAEEITNGTEVTITFPQDVSTENTKKKLIQIKNAADQISSGNYSIDTVKNTVTWTVDNTHLTIVATVDTKAMQEARDVNFSYKVAGYTGILAAISTSLKIEANPIDWAKTGDKSKDNSTLNFARAAFEQAADPSDQYIHATATLELRDHDNNATSAVVAGQSLYVWAEKEGAPNTLAEIEGTSGQCTLEEVGSVGSRIYRMNNIQGDTLTFPVKVESSKNGVYHFYAAQGSNSTLSTAAGVQALKTGKSSKSVTQDLTLLTLTITDDGKVKTDAARTKDNDRGKLNIRVTGTNNMVYVRLPEGFRTEGDVKKTDPVTQKDYYLTPIDPQNPYVKVLEVPSGGAKTYERNADTIDSTDFGLYVNDKLYETVSYDCQINVLPADLQVKITNSGEFRSSSTNIKEPTALQLSLNNIGLGRTNATVYLQQKVGDSSAVSKVKPSGSTLEEVTIGGVEYWKVTATITKVTTGEPVKLEIPLEKVELALNDNEVVNIIVETYNSNEAIYETGSVALRYRMTDTMAEVGDGTSFDQPVDQVEEIVDGKTMYKTNLTLKVNSGYLNGNKLYVWVAQNGESGNGQMAKGRFGVNVNGSDKPWRSFNALLDEGTSNGENNLFIISRKDGDEDLDPNQSGEISIPLTISSEAFGEKYYVRAAFAETATQALSLPADQILSSNEFDFVAVAEIPVITLSNAGMIYDASPYGKIHYTIENMGDVLKRGDKLRMTLPDTFDLPIDTENPDADRTQSLEITLKNPDENGTFSDEIALGYFKAISQADLDQQKYTLLIDSSTLAQCQLTNVDEGLVYDNARFGGEITITHKWAAPDVTVKVEPSEGLTKDAQDQYQLISGNDAQVTVALAEKDGAPNALSGCALAVWLEDGNQKILTKTDYLVIPEEYNVTTKNIASGKQVMTLSPTAEQDTVNVKLKIAGLSNLGSYQIVAQVVKINYDANNSEKITGYTPYTEEGLLFKVVAAPVEKWYFKTVTLNDTVLTGDTTNTYTAADQGFAKELTLKAQLVDAQGNPLADQTVKSTAEGFTIPASQKTDTEGYITITTTTPTVAGSYVIKLIVEGESGLEATVKIPVVAEPSGGGDADKEYANLDLKIERMTNTVARDDRASIYIQAYDDDDELVEVTSDAMAAKIISEVRLTDMPSASDLRKTAVSFHRVGKGIEVYFYPDVVGYYEVTIRGTGTEPTVLRPDIQAVRQGKVVRLELDYPETTLGIGKSSSPAILYTYDDDDVKAEKSLMARGISVYASGSAVESITDVGIVTVRNNSRYAGNTIKVVVTDEKLALQAEYVFDVDEYSSSNGGSTTDEVIGTKRLVLWDNYGGVGLTNRIEFYLTDKSGFRAILDSGQMSSSNGASATVSIASRPSGSTARASIYRDGRTLEDNGYGYLDVYCSKEGTVRLNITIKVYNPDDSTNNTKRYDYYRETVDIVITDSISSSNISSNNGFNNSYSPSGSSNISSTTAGNISVAMFIGSTNYTINMMQQQLDTAPYISNDRVYVPLRALSGALGASVDFDDASQKITLIYNGERVEMRIDSNVVTTTKGGIFQTDAAPEISNGRTMIPLRTAAEALGCRVEAVSNQYGSTIGALFSK